ncbi:tetratricopeptide repeat protein [Magnetovirga frankeli]|uniref:O-linked N-acetylglucosamine transferase, SPINDLY family protein n=1 Tax=Magnetovirga frankeli TaxID=947516 RepID=UPI0012939146|nr:tetratricopeptide repeat protein [gamma proteobacterium SS-5]
MQESSVEVGFAVAIQNAWKGNLDLNHLLPQAESLESAGFASLAAVLYQTWLKRNQTPLNHVACFNLGALLFKLGELEQAKEAYSQAIALAPSFFQPRFNLGMTYEHLGQPEEAVAQWRWIDDHVRPNQVAERATLLMALNNLGRLLEIQKQYHSALGYMTKSLTLEPNQPDVIHHWVFLKAKHCAWPVYQPFAGVTEALMKEHTSALAMISLSDDPETQLSTARQFVKKKVQTDLPALAPSGGYRHQKIRVAYCSSDFCIHPVSMLTVELFELHDRDRFEIYGFCWTNQGNSPLRQRVINGMDHFTSILGMDDATAAQLIRSNEIDILIDLQGQTLGARPNLLAHRPAPIQITYLGLPATTGLPFIDYVIADRFLIPEEYTKYYSEKPIYMPDVYQVSDRQRKHAPMPSKTDCGLPEDAFVFCSFNNNYKYTPEVFAVWMNILRRVPDSVLWLLADNPWSEINLRNAAKEQGIEGDRLFFAPRVSPEEYLARFATADLFLDTFPFNAGTTANDCIWMGLPVLTLTGRSFASRMAGALLTAAKLPELITYDLAEYENKAVELATDHHQYQELRERTKMVRINGVLFDTPRFVSHLEEKMQALVKGAPID